MKTIKISTSLEWPAHPAAAPFWVAYAEHLGADDSPIGTGGTESEALCDLLEQMGLTVSAVTWHHGGAHVEVREVA